MRLLPVDPRLLHRSREHLLRDTADGDGVWLGHRDAGVGPLIVLHGLPRDTAARGLVGRTHRGTRASRVRGPLVVSVHDHYAAGGVGFARRLDCRALRHGARRRRGLPRDLPALRAMDSARRTCACRGAERQRNSPRHGRGDAPYALARRRLRVACRVLRVRPRRLRLVCVLALHLERAAGRRARHPPERDRLHPRAHGAGDREARGAVGKNLPLRPQFGCSCSTTSVRTGVST